MGRFGWREAEKYRERKKEKEGERTRVAVNSAKRVFVDCYLFIDVDNRVRHLDVSQVDAIFG